MKRFLVPAACAAALLVTSVSVDAILAPAAAQVQIGFGMFHDALSPYGAWVYSDRWGEVWVPLAVPMDFSPYRSGGHWVYTQEYGWFWASDYPWGDVAFHYGRWVNDPDDGWLWIPGYQWAPAWVQWRSNAQTIGWMPMPPDRQFLGFGPPSIGIGISLGGGINIGLNLGQPDLFYGYRQWYGPNYDMSANWVFVGAGHMADPDFGRWVAPRGQYAVFIQNTSDNTHYTVVNNYIVNRSIDVNIIVRAGGQPVHVWRATEVIKHPEFVLRADEGQKLQERERKERPHGSGVAGSAPKPSPKVVASLSPNFKGHNGQQSGHLFTKTTVTNASFGNKGTGIKGNETGGGEPKMDHHTEKGTTTNTSTKSTTGGGGEPMMRHHTETGASTTTSTTGSSTGNGHTTGGGSSAGNGQKVNFVRPSGGTGSSNTGHHNQKGNPNKHGGNGQPNGNNKNNENKP